MKNQPLTTPTPLPDKWGQEFANSWLDAWNSHDIERVLEHYSDEFVMASPIARQITGSCDGVLIGKTGLRDFCTTVFQEIPTLRFYLLAVGVGINSLTIHYTSNNYQLVAEVLVINEQWKIIKEQTYY